MKDYACCPHSPSERGGRKQDLEGTPCCSPPALPLCCGTLVPSPQKWSIPCGIQLQNHTPNQLDSQSRAQKSVRTTWPGDSLQDGWSAFCIFFFFMTFVYLCVESGEHTQRHMCGGQRATCGNWFSSCIMWTVGIKLGLWGLGQAPWLPEPTYLSNWMTWADYWG